MHSLKYTFIFIIILLNACSRTAAIRNYHEISYISPDDITIYKAKQRIYGACLKAGWAPVVSSGQMITATFTKKRHIAVVDIAYNLNDYDIIYSDSTNLKYREHSSYPQGIIHRNYNKWVATLNSNIHSMLVNPNEADLAALPADLLGDEELQLAEPLVEERQLITCKDFPEVKLSEQATINRSMVNFRTGAGIHCTSIGILKRGQSFALTGKKNDWYQIAVDGKTNIWIYAPFVKNIALIH